MDNNWRFDVDAFLGLAVTAVHVVSIAAVHVVSVAAVVIAIAVAAVATDITSFRNGTATNSNNVDALNDIVASNMIGISAFSSGIQPIDDRAALFTAILKSLCMEHGYAPQTP